MEGVKCHCDLIAEVKTSHSPNNPNRIFYRCSKPLKTEKCWAEDLPPTQHMGTQSPATSQTRASSPLKRNASFMEESSDFAQLSPSQKRTRLIEAALAEDKGPSGPSISSPNTNAKNISALQSSPSVRLKAKHAAAFPQTPTRSAKRLATYSPSPSPEPFDFELRSQQSSTSTAKDDSMANPFGSREVTAELIGNMVNVIPDYIRKLDSKRVAAEKSVDVRNKKIEYLEDEVQRLKDRQKELELIIADYECKGC